MGLKYEFKDAFVTIILPAIPEIREMIDTAEDENYNKFKDIEWRFGISVSTRMKKKIMAPKYTIKMTMEGTEGEKKYLIDSDYANMVRLRDELQEALKSLDSPFCRKVLFNQK
mmetsp:Transcript_10323/g.9114  ORF Transcript_10323/g.9114 Transcript_10323/m.9114 type:complete len:113 (+) Transcript_10323:216-554(+)